MRVLVQPEQPARQRPVHDSNRSIYPCGPGDDRLEQHRPITAKRLGVLTLWGLLLHLHLLPQSDNVVKTPGDAE